MRGKAHSMKRVFFNLRYSPPTRVDLFRHGFERLGYTVFEQLPSNPEPSDILLSWNRIRGGHETAKQFEQVGAQVLIAENASWGNSFAGKSWLTLCRNFHNCQGRVPYGGQERWDALSIELDDWRKGGECVVLPSRGIGPPGLSQPPDWTNRHRRSGRIRPHPGINKCIPLKEDLAQAEKVFTWGSGAAILACMWGIKVYSEMPSWIGYQTNTDESRLDMLRHLAWAQATYREIESGEAMARLLK
jgi:hypothetical protein